MSEPATLPELGLTPSGALLSQELGDNSARARLDAYRELAAQGRPEVDGWSEERYRAAWRGLAAL